MDIMHTVPTPPKENSEFVWLTNCCSDLIKLQCVEQTAYFQRLVDRKYSTTYRSCRSILNCPESLLGWQTKKKEDSLPKNSGVSTVTQMGMYDVTVGITDCNYQVIFEQTRYALSMSWYFSQCDHSPPPMVAYAKNMFTLT